MKRLLMHVPHGVLFVGLFILVFIHPALVAIPICFIGLFILYELVQDRRKKDGADRDLIGALWGIAAGAVGLAVYLFTRKRK